MDLSPISGKISCKSSGRKSWRTIWMHLENLLKLVYIPFSRFHLLTFRPEENWAHEDQSFLMFMTLIEENDLWPFFEAEGFTDRDLTFIRELIHPPKPIGDAYPFKGRDPGASEGRTADLNYFPFISMYLWEFPFIRYF